MLHIEQNNLLLQNTLTERLYPSDPSANPKSLDRIVSDFDFTTFHVSTLSDRNLILISVYLRCWDDLVNYGVVNYLSNKYANFPSLTVLTGGEIEQGYNFSIVLDVKAAIEESEESKQELIEQLSLLKRHSMAAPFEQAFARYDELSKQYANSNTYSEEVQQELLNEPILVIKYRGIDESIYLKPSFDRVTVIFSTVFQDETDKIFGKVFLQEFMDARKRAVQTAPQVIYTHGSPPLDIQQVVHGGDNDNKGYVTFVLFPRHLVKGDKRDNCISHIELFRSYFHYHIKCAKAYMHSRMRFRVKEFLKILNRAKPENVVEKKTASGRRFDRS
ncbi:ARP2/3 complex 34 kDa subunit [Spathaspora passalidarum NRRL Y-27907]|uniref:Arp2/3 complex 34 kDa subunit n=1 Tax=Spathaspora passalidarum (strain NRRL Y-27907 / 11-Y1) TaxID=619300 RepID=G3AGF3_SPAPN|nr:ARP2/3 complex 34 kDa subunit [Spathaspora passalidarum NRRL Y-27907]EGW35291.1 ARP2/3 complex 34 kDa subunit [Spathaspora passalidarum NRRL Y-27907]